MKIYKAAVLCLIFFASGAVFAQKERSTDGDLDLSNVQDLPGLPQLNPYDKFLGLEIEFGANKIDWRKIHNYGVVDIDADEVEGEVALSMSLGIKISDGMMAIRAKDAEALNSAATQIEDLAKRLGVSDDELSRGHKIKRAANEGKWLEVFMELGFYQEDIKRSLRVGGREDKATLIVSSAWIQGARFVSQIINENYTGSASNFLREPGIVKLVQGELKKLPADYRADPRVKMLEEKLIRIHEIVDIPLDGTIPSKEVQELNRLATEVLLEIIS